MKLIEFEPPPALRNAVGEGVQPGQTMELMAEFRVKDNGNWCLITVEDVPMPGYDRKSPSVESQYVRSAMENMPQRYG